MLEADLEKSKGDKENAVAEERMKVRRFVGQVGRSTPGKFLTAWNLKMSAKIRGNTSTNRKKQYVLAHSANGSTLDFLGSHV